MELHKQGLQIILCIMLLLYILLGTQTPFNGVNTLLGKSIIVAMTMIIIWISQSIILSILMVIAAFELIRRSATSGMLSEETRMSYFNAQNQFPVTLEQEMVTRMAPLVHYDLSKQTYHDTLDNTHNAAPV
jgi:hypothetical protein